MMDYKLMKEQIKGFAETDPWFLPLLSNAAAILYQSLPNINWAGFYLIRGEKLVLGPFQGNPACIHIAIGKGVCGTAVQEKRIVRVEDVHQFPGHIACDSASRSEIVIPLEKEGEIFGVLDIDSPMLNRFSEEDEAGLKEIAGLIQEMIQIPLPFQTEQGMA